MTPKSIGARIKGAREAKGYTASELARLVGVTPTAVANWESRGRRPRAKTLAALCRGLNVTEGFIITGKHGVEPAAPQPPEGPKNIDAILRQAAAQIAANLGIAPDRVKLTCELSFGNE